MRLTAIAADLSDPDQSKITKQIQNWNTVLSSYRSHNNGLTDIFSADNKLFLDMLKSFSKFNKKGGVGGAEFKESFKSFVSSSDLPALSLAMGYFDKTFKGLDNQCSVGMDASRNEYLKSTCSDFATSKSDYRSLRGFLSSACDMPGSPTAGDSNPLRDSVLMTGLCKEGVVTDQEDIPGGLESSDRRNDLMGFMKSKEKYLTFSSNAPVTLTWTSTVSDSISSTATIDSTILDAGDVGAHIGGNVFGVDLMGEVVAGGSKDFHLFIGQTSDSSHEYTRTVTITLDDNDFGEIPRYNHNSNSKLSNIMYNYVNRRLLRDSNNGGSCVRNACLHHYGKLHHAVVMNLTPIPVDNVYPEYLLLGWSVHVSGGERYFSEGESGQHRGHRSEMRSDTRYAVRPHSQSILRVWHGCHFRHCHSESLSHR